MEHGAITRLPRLLEGRFVEFPTNAACLNRLSVAGHPADRAEFRHRASRLDPDGREHLLLLGAVLPPPSRCGDDARQAQHGDPEWNAEAVGSETTAEWCALHWGTSGELAGHVALDETSSYLAFTFTSLGGTPEAWVDTVSGRFPGLVFRLEYLDPTMCTAGEVMYADGVLLERLEAPDVAAVEAFSRRRFGLVL
jgi:hypothetical protein